MASVVSAPHHLAASQPKWVWWAMKEWQVSPFWERDNAFRAIVQVQGDAMRMKADVQSLG